MKKSNLIVTILLILSIFILALSFVDINKEKNKEVEKPDYTTNINFNNDSELLAVAYLNNMEEATSKYIDNFENIKVYQTSGEEIYLIIPRYVDINMKIYEVSLNSEGNLEKGKLIANTNLPFVITCNISDIVSNIIIEVTYKKINFDYSPSLSLKDNSLNTNENILDITEKN